VGNGGENVQKRLRVSEVKIKIISFSLLASFKTPEKLKGYVPRGKGHQHSAQAQGSSHIPEVKLAANNSLIANGAVVSSVQKSVAIILIY
jgi:hypothetical protein